MTGSQGTGTGMTLPASLFPVQGLLGGKGAGRIRISLIPSHFPQASELFRDASHPELSLDPPKGLLPSEDTLPDTACSLLAQSNAVSSSMNFWQGIFRRELRPLRKAASLGLSLTQCLSHLQLHFEVERSHILSSLHPINRDFNPF